MKRLQTRAAAAALSALLLASPACALAAETAPLTLNTQQDATVQASRKDLYQARLGGLSVRLCLFTPEGGGVTFQENLCAAQTGGSGDIRLCMRAGSDQGGLLLQMDQHAVDVLRRVGVTEIVLTDMDFYVQETYLVEDLAAMRDALSLTSGEQLCLGGEDAPITVVSEDGVRRQIAE